MLKKDKQTGLPMLRISSVQLRAIAQEMDDYLAAHRDWDPASEMVVFNFDDQILMVVPPKWGLDIKMLQPGVCVAVPSLVIRKF